MAERFTCLTSPCDRADEANRRADAAEQRAIKERERGDIAVALLAGFSTYVIEEWEECPNDVGPLGWDLPSECPALTGKEKNKKYCTKCWADFVAGYTVYRRNPDLYPQPVLLTTRKSEVAEEGKNIEDIQEEEVESSPSKEE